MNKIAVLLLLLFFCCASSLYASSTLTLTPSREGVFVLQGVGMEDTAALDITVTYDPGTLANPRVDQGGLIPGAMMAVNPNVRGVVRIGIITTNPIRGTGVIATLTFDRVGSRPGKITSIKATLANINGNPLPVQALAENAADTSADTSETSVSPPGPSRSSGGEPSLPGTAGGRVMIGGALVSPPVEPSVPASPGGKEQTAATEPNPVTVQKTPIEIAESAAVSAKASVTTKEQQDKKEERKSYTQKSVLDRFKEYKGERTPKSLMALFNHEPHIGFRQEPAIVLSDGKNIVKVIFIAFAEAKGLPEVSLTHAQLLLIKKDPDNTNTWIAEVLPDKGAWSATLAVKQDKVNMVFPIIVAPKVKIERDKSGKATESVFSRFLNVRDRSKMPDFDLNKDGKKDFVDDYIYTANYIVVSEEESKKQSQVTGQKSLK